jgi:hypothetical protein
MTRSVVLAVSLLVVAVSPVVAKISPCPAGRYLLDAGDAGLIFGDQTPTTDAMSVGTTTLAVNTATALARVPDSSTLFIDFHMAYGLYDHGLATYDVGDTFDQSAAEGFIKIFGLPVETSARKAPAGLRDAVRCKSW